MITSFSVGQTVPWKAKGDFTIFRQIKQMSRTELESKVGSTGVASTAAPS